jgi:hypothetical protein
LRERGVVMVRTLARTALILATLGLLALPLQGCAVGLVAGYLIAQNEKPKTVTTTCTHPTDGSAQVCTTVTR